MMPARDRRLRASPRRARLPRRLDEALAWRRCDMATPVPLDAGAHLVGSVPFADAETVFRTVAGALGPRLRRLPDGETGERRRWIYFQRLMLERHPAMEIDPTVPLFALRQWDGKLLRESPLLRFRAGRDPERSTFETGYASAAARVAPGLRALQDRGRHRPGGATPGLPAHPDGERVHVREPAGPGRVRVGVRARAAAPRCARSWRRFPPDRWPSSGTSARRC